ncbi:hypothetical protein SV7mr_42060 [Stieleria bergensis]|uniref:Uncharacterized protein n=1 Tax=Stieleria bergensis TaxID=2528025 RepID=A0A517SZU8_9BACT|nr:hypothetical protein SV7mr_42060 [Planctomycetes bacterium SV_7m_r]
MVWRNVSVALLGLGMVVVGWGASPRNDVAAEDPAAEKTYSLRYALKEGQQLHYQVTHVAKTKTRINGTEEQSSVHTISDRHWEVVQADDESQTFDHILDSVQMTQQAGDKEEVRWSSKTDEIPPTSFQNVASQIGKAISTISINARGQELDRVEAQPSKSGRLGMGTLAIAMPEDPIAVGASWSIPREIKTKTPDKTVKMIKIRELYTLKKVSAGVATISVRSEPLTPIHEESVRAQVIQQLSNGTIRFDLDAGHMISKELTWDETVVGFQGASSMMEYRARMTEQFVDDVVRTATRP